MTTSKTLIASLKTKNILSVKEIGSKAHNLMKLHNFGFNIPSGFVITADTVKEFIKENNINIKKKNIKRKILKGNFPEHIQKQILRMFLDTRKLVSVRSSGVSEDLGNKSFAGQYETYLSVGEKDLLEKIKLCIASAFNVKVKKYSKNKSSDFAVIVQDMVNAKVAGVCFTKDPITNVNYVTVNFSKGLGENVASGIKKTYSVVVQEKEMSIISSTDQNHILKNEEIKEIVKTSLGIEKKFGAPQDIEWALDEELYFLQSRDITTTQKNKKANSLDSDIDKEYPIYTRANIGEVLPGTITPLTWSVVGTILDDAFYNASKHYGLLKENKKFLGYFYNRAYLNASLMFALANKTHLSSIDEFKKTVLGENYDVMFEDLHTDKSSKYIKTFWAIQQLKWLLLTMKSRFNKSNKLVEQYLNIPVKNKLSKTYEEFSSVAKEVARLHILISQINSSFTGKLFIYANKHNKNPNFSIDSYFASKLTLESAKSSQELVKIAKEIKKDKKLLKALKSKNALAVLNKLDSFKEFLSNYGHRGPKEAELSENSWDTNPKIVIDLLKTFVNVQNPKRNKVIEEPRLSFFKNIVFDFLLNYSIKYSSYRELQKNSLIRIINHLRKSIRANYKSSDIYFLTIDELLSSNKKNKKNNSKLIKLRKREYNKNSKILDFPDIIDCKIILSNHKVSGRKTKGISCYPGLVTGVAQIVNTPTQKVKPGKILVMKGIDAGWAPLFYHAKGIITDKGGVLSHGAIIAREYGIPTIVDTQTATKLIKTGDKIILDANTGEVFIK